MPSFLRFFAASFICVVTTVSSFAADGPNALTDEEKSRGFQLLFDGAGLAGWEHSGNWKVEDGAICREGRGGSLVYKTKAVPDDFELRFEWKVAEGSNSGVYYRPGQYEYQILDNRVHRDGQNPRTSAASLYFCVAPSKDATRPIGEWNEGRVVCKGTVVQHWLNGQKVIDIDYADPNWAENVELLRRRGGDLTARGAFLSVQDHGDPVWYRAIKLRELKPEDELDRTPITPAAIPAEALQHEKEILERIEKNRAKAKKAGKKNQDN
ncbi:MAG: 3-keto-disaccharide hydrolase [Planctomycetota bacterium]